MQRLRALAHLRAALQAVVSRGPCATRSGAEAALHALQAASVVTLLRSPGFWPQVSGMGHGRAASRLSGTPGCAHNIALFRRARNPACNNCGTLVRSCRRCRRGEAPAPLPVQALLLLPVLLAQLAPHLDCSEGYEFSEGDFHIIADRTLEDLTERAEVGA